MGKLEFVLTLNADETVTVRRGRDVEHFDAKSKTEWDLVDTIRWSLISKGCPVSFDTVHDFLVAEKRRVA